MAKAIFHKLFNATDARKGVSIRVHPKEEAQSFPEWVVALAVEAGAAERVKPKRSASADTSKEKGN